MRNRNAIWQEWKVISLMMILIVTYLYTVYRPKSQNMMSSIKTIIIITTQVNYYKYELIRLKRYQKFKKTQKKFIKLKLIKPQIYP
jgi:uncharacterized membrane protein